MTQIKILSSLVLILSFLSIFNGCSWLGGDYKYEPEEMEKHLSQDAKNLVSAAFSDVDKDKLVDYHVHVLGLNPKKNGTFVNENWQNFFYDPKGYLQFSIYQSAAGIDDLEKVDAQYLYRLNKLVKYQPNKGTYGLMAFDYFHHDNGNKDLEMSTFRVPNKYMLKVVQSNPKRYFPIASIHPYRDDALEELTYYAKKKVRFIKWLPNAMGINPSSEDKKQELMDFYKIMKKYDMVLISHTGDEKATHAEEYQRFGNPVYLKLPLDMGVKVVMAHLATLGSCKEIEVEEGLCKADEAYIDIALEMMRNEKYKANLFGEISALTQFNRQHNILKVFAAHDIHNRLINGSDYPLPAVNAVIRTGDLENLGYITTAQRKLLNEIYNYNPLLFDYVLKRTLRVNIDGESVKLPAEVFMKNLNL